MTKSESSVTVKILRRWTTPASTVRSPTRCIPNSFLSDVQPHSVELQSGFRPRSLQSPRPKLSPIKSALQRVENFFISTPTEEERALELARRLRHIARCGGVIPEKFREIEASFNGNGSRVTTPNGGTSKPLPCTKPERNTSHARPTTLDLSNPGQKRPSPPKVVPKDTGITVKDALALAEAHGINDLSLMTSKTAANFDAPKRKAPRRARRDLFFDFKKSKLTKGFEKEGPRNDLQARPEVQYLNGCQPSTSNVYTLNNSVFPEIITMAQPPLTLDVCDGNVTTELGVQILVLEDYPDSATVRTKKNDIPSPTAIRRESIMNLQNAMEKQAIYKFVSRRLTKRLVRKESLDDWKDDWPTFPLLQARI